MSADQLEIRAALKESETNTDPHISEAIRNTAAAIVEDAANVQEGQNVVIWFDPPGIQLVKEMDSRCKAKGANVRFFMRDYEGDAKHIINVDKEEIKNMFNEEEELLSWADNVLLVRNPQNPEAMGKVPQDKVDIYFQRYAEVHNRRITGDVDWTLFLWPTSYEAQKEGLPYDEYFRQVMEACNQPWGEIKKAQSVLKEKLDTGTLLEFHANEGAEDQRKQTHLAMSIEGMTFCNSTIDRNYPGSEVFSAPVLDSVNGQIYAEGEYLEDGHLMKNIFLRIENGRIVEARAEEGDDGLQMLLNRDNDKEGYGSRYFGECALGTNGGLLKRFFNPLLNEKVGGSFHMAIGHCYEMTEYAGEPVNVNNGNTEESTSLHWDLTILMHRKQDGSGGGRIVLDGEEIQTDGFFNDPALGILNPRFPQNN